MSPAPRSRLRDDGQQKSGSVRRIVKDGVGGASPLGGSGRGFARVQIAIETREIAAGNFQADAMACAKNVAGGPEIDSEGVDLARREECGSFLRIAIFCAEDSFGDVHGGTVRRNINELAGEVGVHRG